MEKGWHWHAPIVDCRLGNLHSLSKCFCDTLNFVWLHCLVSASRHSNTIAHGSYFIDPAFVTITTLSSEALFEKLWHNLLSGFVCPRMLNICNPSI